MAVRSTSFFTGAAPVLPATWTRLYLTPPGRTARFSLVTVQHNAGTQWYLGTGTALLLGAVIAQDLPAGAGYREILRGLVLDPDEALWGWVGALNVSFSGFGSLLLGAPT